MNLLFVGSIYHQHIYNFSKALKNIGHNIYAFDLAGDTSKKTEEDPFVRIWHKPTYHKSKILNLLYKTFGTLFTFVSIKEKIDIVQFNYLDIYYTLPLLVLSKIKRFKVSCFVYGSDFLRAGKLGRLYLKFVFRRADCIVCDSLLLHKQLQQFMPSIREKFYVLNFGSVIIDDLNRSLEKGYNKSVFARDRRLNVMCGYNGYRAQNHVQIIESLQSYKDAIHLLIPMTYGEEPSYPEELRTLLVDKGFSFDIYTNFIPDTEWEGLLMETDIFIHMQLSDAFSSSLAEHLYLGNIVINAEWLKYDELSQNNVYYLTASFDNLSQVFGNLIKDYEKEKDKHRGNGNIMYKLKSLEYCCKHFWVPYFESMISL